MFIALVILVVIFIVAWLAIPGISKDKVATGLVTNDNGTQALAGCGESEKCTSSTSTKKENAIDAFAYSVPKKEVIPALVSVINEFPGAAIVTSDEQYLHATFQTKLMRYIDDVEFLIGSEVGVLQVRSASRIGRKDLGANRKRIEQLRSLSKEKL